MSMTPHTTPPLDTNGTPPAPPPDMAPITSSLALPTASQARALAFEPRNFPEALEVAGMVASIRLCGVTSQQEAMGKIMLGAQLGWPVMVSLMNIWAMPTDKGPTLGIYAQAMRALASNHPQCEYLRCTLYSADKVTCVIKRKGHEPVELSWTNEDSERAGLVGRGEKKDGKSTNNHDKYPAAMKLARCSAALIRLELPAAIMGLYAIEEIQDGVVPEQPAQHAEFDVEVVRQAQARDFAGEKESIKAEIAKAKTDEDKAACRRAIKTLADDGQNVADLRSFYEATHGKPTKKAEAPAAAAAPVTPPAPVSEPAKEAANQG